MMMWMNEKKVHNGRYLLCYEISPVLLCIVEQTIDQAKIQVTRERSSWKENRTHKFNANLGVTFSTRKLPKFSYLLAYVLIVC